MLECCNTHAPKFHVRGLAREGGRELYVRGLEREGGRELYVRGDVSLTYNLSTFETLCAYDLSAIKPSPQRAAALVAPKPSYSFYSTPPQRAGVGFRGIRLRIRSQAGRGQGTQRYAHGPADSLACHPAQVCVFRGGSLRGSSLPSETAVC